MTGEPALDGAIISVRAQKSGEAVKSSALRLLAQHPPIGHKISEIIEDLANEKDLFLPRRWEVEDMCYAKLAELIRRPRLAQTIETLASTVIRSLRSKVAAEYDRTWEDSPPLPNDARRHVKNRRLAEDANVEPTEMAWAELLNEPAEEIRAARFAYNLSRLGSFNGDWVIRGSDGFAVAVRRGRKNDPSRCEDECGEALNCESLCDLHDRCGG
jgi:hypothetical protein